MKRTMLLSVLVLIAATSATAQKVYRCGPDANVYSQQPCADGKALDVADPRSAAAQQREARAAAAQDAKQANAMQREREQAERQSKPPAAASLGPAPQAAAAAAKPPTAAASKPTLYREPVKPKS